MCDDSRSEYCILALLRVCEILLPVVSDSVGRYCHRASCSRRIKLFRRVQFGFSAAVVIAGSRVSGLDDVRQLQNFGLPFMHRRNIAQMDCLEDSAFCVFV